MSKLIVNEIEKYDAGQLTITTGTNVSIGSDLTVGGALNATLSTAAQTNITSVGTLSSLAVSGDLTVDTSTLKVDSTNNRVGIGTASPTSLMHIVEDSGQARLLIEAPSGQNSFVGFQNTGGTQPAFLIGYNATDSAFVFYDDIANTERMRIDSSGNVLINRTSVNATYLPKLEVVGTANDGTEGILIGSYLPTLTFQDFSGGSTIGQIQQDGTGLVFKNNGSERMRIDSSGNVGIGTSSPASKFEVSNSNTATDAAGPVITISNESGAITATDVALGSINFESNDPSSGGTGVGGSLGVYSERAFDGGPANTYMAFSTRQGSTLSEKVRITSVGNIITQSGQINYPNSGDLLLNASDAAGQIQFRVAGAERGRFTTNGLSFPNGNGIDFSASAGAGASSSLLDDYEEGTFTPTAFGETTSGTTSYTNRYGFYTKIGRQVNITLLIGWSSLTGTGNLRIGGLPFTSANIFQNAATSTCQAVDLNWSGGSYLIAILSPNDSEIRVQGITDNASATSQQCVNESASLRITLTYMT